MQILFAKSIFRILSLILISSILISCNSGEEKNPIDQDLHNKMKAGKVLLPNGWSLTSPSNSLPLDELPLNLQLSPSGRLAAVTNTGDGKQSGM